MNTNTTDYRSECPVSTALDVIGDKWSLLVVRDMCMKKTRYGEFLSSPEHIPTNILANRLRRLEESGIIEKSPYRLKPLRYEYFLTYKGANLLPVLQQLAIWANQYTPSCNTPPDWFLIAKTNYPATLIRRSANFSLTKQSDTGKLSTDTQLADCVNPNFEEIVHVE